MIRKLFCALIFLLTARLSWAETRYISDQLRVPLRDSACRDCPTVHDGLTTGTPLTLLKEANGWSNVQTTEGLAGWLPSIYLIKQAPARDRITSLENQIATLTVDNKALAEQAQTLKTTNTELQLQLDRFGGVGKELGMDMKTLANAVSTQQQNDELLKRNKMLQSEVDVLTANREQLEHNRDQSWFLYGGVAVFLGALLSVLLPRLKRSRKGYSEWG